MIMSSSTRIRRVGRKTGPKPRFTKADVINVAVELGLDQFTLGAVAAKLGIATSAMYRLFDSRDALVDACLEQAAADLGRQLPTGEVPWADLLRAWAETMWDVCEKYPGLSITLFQYPQAFSHIQSYMQSSLEVFISQGFTEAEALFAWDFVGDTVVATHIGITAMHESREDVSVLEDLIDTLNTGSVFGKQHNCGYRGFLDAKLDFIIEGIKLRFEQRPQKT